MRNLFLLALVSLVIVACDSLPDNYQGEFSDKTKGIKLTLDSIRAKIEFRGGRKIEAKGKEMTVENIMAAKPGLYVKQKGEDDKGIMDVYYINPNMGTKKNEEGFIWFQAELIYTQLELAKRSPVKQIQLVHCKEGIVMVDAPSRRWQVGCPAGPETYTLNRTKAREVPTDPFEGR